MGHCIFCLLAYVALPRLVYADGPAAAGQISREQIVSLVEPRYSAHLPPISNTQHGHGADPMLLLDRKFPLKPADLLLLINFVNAHAPAFRSSAHLAPICLPVFNDTGFLYAYVHFLLHDLCIVFVTAKDDVFHKLHEAQTAIQDKLASHGLMQQVIADTCAVDICRWLTSVRCVVQLEAAIEQPRFSIQSLVCLLKPELCALAAPAPA